jgi:hypothetical protein
LLKGCLRGIAVSYTTICLVTIGSAVGGLIWGTLDAMVITGISMLVPAFVIALVST